MISGFLFLLAWTGDRGARRVVPAHNAYKVWHNRNVLGKL